AGFILTLGCYDSKRLHCFQFLELVAGDLRGPVIGEDVLVVLHYQEAVLDVLRHHPEPLLTFPDLPIGDDPPANIFQYDGQTFAPVFKNGWNGFLPEEPFSSPFEVEGDLVVLVGRPGRERFEQLMYIDIRGIYVRESFSKGILSGQVQQFQEIIIYIDDAGVSIKHHDQFPGITEHGRERNSLGRGEYLGHAVRSHVDLAGYEQDVQVPPDRTLVLQELLRDR